MTAAQYTDEKYYQAAAPRSLGERLMIMARDRIYADFVRCCRPDLRGHDPRCRRVRRGERRRQHAGAEVSVPGAHHGGRPRRGRRLPPAVSGLVNYVRIEANKPLPFADKAFDIATSNAVLEHVGSTENQVRFVAELLRVARRVFVSVPHRYFPVEHHTAIPLLHFWDASFARRVPTPRQIRMGRPAESDPDVEAIGCATLSRRTRRSSIGRTGIPLGPFSSNLYLFADHAGPGR